MLHLLQPAAGARAPIRILPLAPGSYDVALCREHLLVTTPFADDLVIATVMNLDSEILVYEGELRAAQLASDVEALDRLLDDALVFTSFDGTLASKADDLAMHRSGRMRITRMEPMERRMLHLGQTSVVNVKMDAAALIDGAPIEAVLRYTRVWHKRDEGWRVVAGHMGMAPR